MSVSTVARATAIALNGVSGEVVQVEAAVSVQTPGMAIIGLPDTAVAEAKQRVKLAVQHSGYALSEHFLTVNLSPAALPKRGTGFDLAIALTALAASGEVPADTLAETAHVGELGLDGSLRRPPGLLSAVVAAQEHGFRRVLVPADCREEAALVAGVEVVGAPNLTAAAMWHGADAPAKPPPGAATERGTAPASAPAPTARGADAPPGGGPTTEPGERAPGTDANLSDVVGQPAAIEALIVAAAGRHHLLMIGPPGAGKTLLASRLPGILPPLGPREALRASAIASLDVREPLRELRRLPPFESPHHTATAAALIGGGTGADIVPGAVTRACHGVLFLDEVAQFQPAVLDGLRQPLESGRVDIVRARGRTRLPADVQLVLAANPCPCGFAGVLDGERQCECPPAARRRYLARVSGPLGDRIDVRMVLNRVSRLSREPEAGATVTTEEARERVSRARRKAEHRLSGTPWRVNAQLPGAWLRHPRHRPERSATVVLDTALARGGLTLRGYDRTLRLAWTVADLAGVDRPGRPEIAQALALRLGEAP